ncbi:hypothetical protein QCA50_001306 [Cerrena zonata]|uniref:RNase III domain-containing protein n=1 Tax=Cerrena zonata TaxID=2478898 RepID=A0AAW0GZB6_9APHY
MRIKPFLPKVWQPALPPLVKTFCAPTGGNDTKIAGPGEGSSKPKRGKRQKQRDEQGVQWIGDKTVADVVEAIIGAAYLSKDRDLALWVSKRLKVSLPKVNQWSDLRSMYVVPTGLPAIEVSPKTISGVEKIVRFKFQKTDVLAEALTHGSKQQTLGYDRLEFLGDAILDFYVVKHVFERYPHLSSGGLSMLKSAMVINTSLAAFCVISGLDQYVQYTSTDMQQSFKAYSDKIKALHLQELQLAKEEGRQPGQFWLEIPAPKVLSDVVESVLGALFVSEGFSETGTDAFFYGALQPFLDEYVRMQTLSHHPSIGLYEWFQGEGCQEHQIVKSSEGNQTECKVIVHDVILASAMDPAPTTARRLAASYALDALEGDPLFMSKVCDCRANKASKKLQKKVLGYEDDEDDAVS